MGLDSVELVMEFEKYFNITIPDKEAEKADTVEKIVNCIANLKDITEEGKEMQQKMFDEIKLVLIKNKICNKGFNIENKLIDFLPADDIKWNHFQEKLELDIPKPYYKNSNHYIFSKIQKIANINSLTEYDVVLFSNLTDAILACTFRELLN